MRDIEKLTYNFKPIETRHAEKIYPYYSAFFKTRKYPRFYQSILETSQYVNVPLYYWGEVNNCLVILVKRHIHRPVLYLIIPPISKNLDHAAELEVINLFAKYGLFTRLSEEDMDLYGFSKDDVVQDKNNCEFIYLSGDLLTMEGKKWGDIRYKVNKFNKLVEEEKAVVLLLNDINYQQFLQCKHVYDLWLRKKGMKSVHSAHKVLLNSPKEITKLITLIYDSNRRLAAWGASEKIGEGMVIQTTRFRLYENTFFIDPSLIIHHRECVYWSNFMGKNTLCNFGTGLFKHLIEHKQRMKPVKTLQLYNLKVEKTVDKADWDVACNTKQKGLFFNG